MGRPKQPTKIHLVKGTAAKDPKRMRARAKEPTPRKGKVMAPVWLSDRGKTAFNDLVKITTEMDVLTTADRPTLAMVCDAFADYQDFGRLVEEHGATYETFNREGERMLKANPAVTMKADAWRRVVTGLRGFGLDPASRASVKTISDKKPASSLAEFLGSGH